MLPNTSPKNFDPSNFHKPKLKTSSVHANSSKILHKVFNPPSVYQSVSTLQKGVQVISFPKAVRTNLNPPLSDDSSFSIFTRPSEISYKSKRSTSFGYGNKQFIPPSVLKNAKAFPASNNYKIPSQFDNLNKGKTFGVSREHFEKTSLPGIDQMPLGVAKELPGPGQYEMIVRRKPGFTIVGKGNGFNKNVVDEGPIRLYNPNRDFVESGRYKSIMFGVGKRSDVALRKEPGPGPGTYDYIGIFQKYKNKNQF